jgi:DNA repair protein RadC
MLYTKANGRTRAATKSEVLEAAAEYLLKSMSGRVDCSLPAQSAQVIKQAIAAYDHEVFGMLVLDNRHRVIVAEIMFRGTVNGSSVYPREVVKRTLELNGAAVIFFHNHPSGVAEASRADELITRQLREALALIDVRTLDHFIVTGDKVISLAEQGVLW